MWHNKRFKTDSQRSAALVFIGFCGYGAVIECWGSVAHHLSGRYVPVQFYHLTKNYLNNMKGTFNEQQE